MTLRTTETCAIDHEAEWLVGWGGCAGARDVVSSLSELLDDLGAERRQISRLAARDEAPIDDDFLIDPFAASVDAIW